MMSRVEILRRRLADRAATDSIHELSNVLIELAGAEGESYVKFVTSMSEAKDLVWKRAAITEMLLHGADDKWSGRGNDVRRAYFDGVCRAARDALR